MTLFILRLCTILIHSLILLLLVHVHPGVADPPGPPPDPYGPSFNPSMGAVIIVLLGALFFMGFFSIYIRHYSQDDSVSGSPSSQQRRVFMGSSLTRARRAPRGLDRAVVESFPTFDYSSVKELKIGKGALECAVCLTEFEDDDVLRLLPNCDHVFHPECIDTWLVGHTTCPVCRSDLVPRDRVEVGHVSLHVPMETDGNNADLIMDGTTSMVEEGSREDHEEEEEYIHHQQVQLHRNRTMRRDISFGRPRWLGRMRFGRSYSTGHVAVKQWEDMERFTLRLPEEVRKQLVSGKLERTISLVVLPRETSSRRGYRTGTGTGTGLGEGSSRGGRFGSNRSDRWVFSLVPPFFSRASSVKSPKVMEPESRRDGSIRSDSSRLPVS